MMAVGCNLSISTVLVMLFIFLVTSTTVFSLGVHARAAHGAIDNEQDQTTVKETEPSYEVHGDVHDQHLDMNIDLTNMLDEMLNKYDGRIRPNAAGPPTTVETNMYIISGFSTVAATMDYNIMAFIRQKWNDPRLKFNHTASLNVDIRVVDLLWVPDMYITNEKDGKMHSLTVRNEALRIYPGGDILLSMRVSLTLACNMNLRKYPMDVQICHLTMESFGFRTHDVQLKWAKDNPIELNNEILIAEFATPQFKEVSFNATYVTGVFSSLRVYFILNRIYDYHIIQSYIPTFLMVIISWISFWLNPESVPARVTLGVTTVLTVTTLSGGVRAGLPKVAYVKAIDVWMTACLGFVFGALIEFALVNYLLTEEKNRKEKANKLSKASKEKSIDNVEMDTLNEGIQMKDRKKDGDGDASKTEYVRSWLVKTVRHRSVDKVSRILFPVAFGLFNIIYWPVCFHGYYDDRLAEL
ncbi:glycine receptor subunit alpha-2-like [Saccoglossus kowalevskii]